MNELKYVYKSKYGEFKVIEYMLYNNKEKYPLFDATYEHIFSDDLFYLNYPLSVFKSTNKSIIDSIRKNWNKKTYEFFYENYYYLVLLDEFRILDTLNSVIISDLSEFEVLGCLNLDKRLIEEIFELDQILQSTNDLDFIIDMLKENTDMNKYIEFIKKNIKKEDMETLFSLMNIFMKYFQKISWNIRG